MSCLVPAIHFRIFRSFSFSYYVASFMLLCLVTGNAAASEFRTAKVTLLENREYSDALLRSIGSAGKNIFVSSYLFKITESHSNLPGKIARELAKAAHRGVAVTVILEISDDADDPLNGENRRTGEYLAQRGVRVLHDSARIRSHLKAVMIDDRYVFIGSHNLTQSALKYNNELSVLIDSPELASKLRDYLNNL